MVQGVVKMVSRTGGSSLDYNLRNNFFNASLYLKVQGTVRVAWI